MAKTRQTNDLDFDRDHPTRRRAAALAVEPARGARQGETGRKHRVVLRNLARLEARNLFYSAADKPNKSTLRFRERVELQCALTRPRVTDNGATYALGDAEWFWQLDDVSERYANKQRVRGGIGYRDSSCVALRGTPDLGPVAQHHRLTVQHVRSCCGSDGEARVVSSRCGRSFHRRCIARSGTVVRKSTGAAI